ncbi:unnamed protein product, partial [Rhizoctonia solani]
MDLSNVDMKLFEEFMQFRAFKAAAEAKQKAQEDQDREPSRGRSPTVGHESSPMDTREEQRTAEDEDRKRSPTIGRSSDPADVDHDTGSTPVPFPHSNTEQKKGKGRAEKPRQDDSTPTVDEDEQDEHTSTPRAFRKQDKPNKNASKSVATSRKRDRSPDPEPGPSKRHRSPDPPAEQKPVHPYDTCPTSYELRPKKRGGRVKILVNGRGEIARTRMERLIHRKAKYKHVLKHGHLFGDKHGCYFNPYSKSRVNEVNCKRIPKPDGFQVGRGGPNARPWHWEIGLRDDYDLAMDIRGTARKALVKFRPKSLDLKPGTKLTYKHYKSKERVRINNYMYDHFPFLFHFRLESGEDSWAIDAICTGYLVSNSAYTKSGKNTKAKLFLKRNASGPGGNDEDKDEDEDKDDDEDDDEDEEGKPSEDDSDNEGYEDDYKLNARRHAKDAPTSKSQPSISRSSTTKKRAREDKDDSRSSKKQKVRAYGQEADDNDNDSSSDSSSDSDKATLPPKPTTADVRKADKQVAKEKVRDKAIGASRDKVGAKPPAAPKGKGKGRESSPVAPKPKNAKRKMVVLDEDEDEDDEPAVLVSKQIRRTEATLNSSDETEPASKKAPPKSKSTAAPKPK